MSSTKGLYDDPVFKQIVMIEFEARYPIEALILTQSQHPDYIVALALFMGSNDGVEFAVTEGLKEAESRMSKLTKAPNVLMRRWMEIYMNMNMILSTDPRVTEALNEMKDKLAEANGRVMAFFDLVGANLEAEA